MNTHTTPPPLDADIVEQLDTALESEPMDGAAHTRVKNRLLRRIAEDAAERHLHLPSVEVGWQPFGEGLSIKVLHESGGVMSYLLRIAAGAGLPAHRHPLDEECVVLEGEVCIGDKLRLGPGGFHLGRKDVLHDRLYSPEGALIFLRGAVPEAALAI